jgi:hypothetical protein
VKMVSFHIQVSKCTLTTPCSYKLIVWFLSSVLTGTPFAGFRHWQATHEISCPFN